MNCDKCVNKGRMCLNCAGQFYAKPVVKPKREVSEWEQMWNDWAKAQKQK